MSLARHPSPRVGLDCLRVRDLQVFQLLILDQARGDLNRKLGVLVKTDLRDDSLESQPYQTWFSLLASTADLLQIATGLSFRRFISGALTELTDRAAKKAIVTTGPFDAGYNKAHVAARVDSFRDCFVNLELAEPCVVGVVACAEDRAHLHRLLIYHVEMRALWLLRCACLLSHPHDYYWFCGCDVSKLF